MSFDILNYITTARGVADDDVDYSAFQRTLFLLRYLMGGTKGARMIRQIDEKIDRLPGLTGMHLVSGAAARYGVGPQATSCAIGPVQRAGSMLWSLLRSPSLSR